MKRPVLVLAGGTWQIPIIQFLKAKGHKVYVVDPHKDSPGVIIADGHIMADVRDNNLAEKLQSQSPINDWEFVISDQSDVAMPNVATISKLLGLPGNSLNSVELFTNKFRMREFADSIGVPIPRFAKAENINDIQKFIQKIKKPSIIKPADSQSSRGIVKLELNNNLDLNETYNECKTHSKLNYILIEEFFNGIEITVEGFCSNGIHKSIAFSRKNHFRVGIASELNYPADIPETILNEVSRVNDLFVEKSGLSFGITHSEYLVDLTSGQFIMVEIACRGGGSLISSNIAPWVSGWPIYEFLYQNLLGNIVDIKNLPIRKRSAILHFFEFPNGTVTQIEGVNEIKKLKEVIHFQLDFVEGSKIYSATDDRSRQGFVVILTDNKIQSENILNKVKNLLDIIIK